MCPFEFWIFFSKMISYPEKNYLLASPRNIGVHTSIPEYASITGISIVMTMPFHVKPFQKKFLKKWFSPQISSKPSSPQETDHIKKREEKRKAPRVSSNKWEVNILRREKYFNFKNPFYVIPFSPPPSYHFPFQNH
jgi:hypothetical protein